MPNEDIAEMFLNLTEHPYAGVYRVRGRIRKRSPRKEGMSLPEAPAI